MPAKEARADLAISARRKSLSISPLKRRASPIDDPIDLPTGGQIGTTLNEDGPPGRQHAQNIPPGVQETASSATRNIPYVRRFPPNSAILNEISVALFSAATTSLNLGIAISFPLPAYLGSVVYLRQMSSGD